VRDVAIVTGGTGAAQAITVAFSPIITRLYGPEAFGILGAFVALTAMISPAMTLTYGLAIVLPDSDKDARLLARLAISIASALAALLLVVFGVFHRQIANAFGLSAVAPYLLLIPGLLWFSSLVEVLSQWLIRKKRFRAISGVAVAQAGAVDISTTGIGLVAATGPMLLVVNSVGRALYAGLLWRAARPTLVGERNRSRGAAVGALEGSQKTVAHNYRDFPLYRAPQVVISAISQNIPTLLLAMFFGPVPAGFYALSRRVLQFPSSLVSQSVGTVFLPRIAEAARRGEGLRPYIIKATGGLALVGLLPFGAIISLGPLLFRLIFGAEWSTAGEYARWMGLWLFFTFMNVPSVQATPLMGLQRGMLIFEVLVLGLRVGALAFGAFGLASDVAAIALFSIVGAVCNAALIAWVVLRAGGRLREGMRGGGTI
jgi:O-antigen/teichoic acid export membrane protein